jgi:hypothetical protein
MSTPTKSTIDATRRELETFRDMRESGDLTGLFTAREIELVAIIDAWAATQPAQVDPLDDTGAIFGIDPASALHFEKRWSERS